jgi:hypothetical protein
LKTLYVCGDSFLTPSALNPNTHFTEIISKKLGYELTVLAHGGMSNNGICLQTEAAIANNASFIIVSPTYYDRIEIPIIDKLTNYNAADLFYYGYTYSNYDSKVDRSLFSDSINSLLSEDNSERFKEIPGMTKKIETLKNYLVDLYNINWKQQQDIWALYAIFHKLHMSNIPYLIVLDRKNITSEFNWLTEKNNTMPYIDIQHYVDQLIEYSKQNNINADPGYHTFPKDQIIIANKILEHIEKFNILT